MANRKQFTIELTKVNDKYVQLRLQLLKLNAKRSHFTRLDQIRNKLEAQLRLELMDDLDALNRGKFFLIK